MQARRSGILAGEGTSRLRSAPATGTTGRWSWTSNTPFAGMTQAGSTGMISAGIWRAPRWTRSICETRHGLSRSEPPVFGQDSPSQLSVPCCRTRPRGTVKCDATRSKLRCWRICGGNEQLGCSHMTILLCRRKLLPADSAGSAHTMTQAQSLNLPNHNSRRYPSAGACIYCRSRDRLSDEHIVPYAAGGRWVLPDASCKNCATVTGTFEGEVSRTILGPLRMLYNMPTRRKKERPRHLPLKVKYPSSTDWEVAYVDRSICPFLVGLPLYPMPDALTRGVTEGNRSAATANIWIRGAAFWRNRDAHLQWLCDALGAVEVMPTATVHTEPFCLMLAKIAHAFAVAELGLDGFHPFLPDLIRARDLSNRARFIGGGRGDEPASEALHELNFDTTVSSNRNVIAVRVRLLGNLGTPTYHVAVGLRDRET